MMKFDFYKSVDNLHDVLVETLEDITDFGKMDDFYILTDFEGNQFIRNFHNYSGIDVWYSDDEGNPVDENPVEESNVIRFPSPEDFVKDNPYNRYLANIQGYNG